MSFDWIWWTVVPGMVIAMLGYAYYEYMAYLLRTQVIRTSKGLRFVAHGLTVEMNRNKQVVSVKSRYGHYTYPGEEGEPPKVKMGTVTASFEPMGLRIEVNELFHKVVGTEAPRLTGRCRIEFQGGEDKTHLRIDNIPVKVAQAFDAYADQLRSWIEKLEERREQKVLADAAKAEALAAEEAAKAAKAAGKAPVPEMTVEEQLAAWRKAAGFTGSSSEIGLNEAGGIVWFIDLEASGKITLHSDKRTVHTTLRGAEIASLGGELELGVRDAFWNESEPELRRFRVLKGRSPEERRAWKERLEILRDSLRANAGLQG